MLNTYSSSSQESALQIKQNDKFFSRLLSKETSMANPSFRVYYCGVSSSVPFMWESKPGTPKSSSYETPLPPLTPPPSYQTHARKPIKRRSKSSLFLHLLPRIMQKKSHLNSFDVSSSFSSSTRSLSSESSSSMSMSMCTPSRVFGRGRSSTVRSMSFDHAVDIEDLSSSPPTLCFKFKM
ncbi:hypothetical protein Nepgr_031963 [Nepenthes gracilis]|uniref:Uncharacterized protein n=1 Tax=Nepenthes gracilis TaxID=150966 RepID=A0AAD3Y7A9_NEPGR|nr:hypothetical protein Nepgr_031963 [Nepenthes gracilis]